MLQSDSRLLELVTTPALLLRETQVAFANVAATELLGAHIVGQDVRIAIRVPEALTIILANEGGQARVDGLSIPGSVWRVTCHLLDRGDRLVLLEDMSVRVSVARAHADFVANASHELRTPLASILGYVETLGNPAASEDRETREKFLGTIRHEAQRMQALVEDLMSLSRIEAGKHDIPAHTIDLASVVRACVAALSESTRVELKLDAKDTLVFGDEGQLAQAVRNLVENALKYGAAEGKVTVTLESTASNRLLLTVQDEGSGIPPEHLPRITERFYRVDAGRSRAAGGTGLGLAIVKHIVERHRGRFDITSRLGHGTTAAIILPLKTG